jgi:hypothetical protein
MNGQTVDQSPRDPARAPNGAPSRTAVALVIVVAGTELRLPVDEE